MNLYIFCFQFLSLLSIIWSTQFQHRLYKERPPFSKYFYHALKSGSVCQFGIDSGKILTLLILFQMIFTQKFLDKKDKDNLKTLRKYSIIVLVFIFIMMLLMNSSINNKIVNKEWKRGLFENSIPFFFFQLISIWLISKKIKS